MKSQAKKQDVVLSTVFLLMAVAMFYLIYHISVTYFDKCIF